MVTSAPPTIAFLFPGQASQRVGMAADLLETQPSARPIFQQAGEVLGLDLAQVCTSGSDALLTRTDIAQPALLTTCVAWLAAVRDRGIAPRMLAGHSLGEFAAWVAAEALDFDSALRLVRRRGELMAEAAQRSPGGMLAIIGLSDDKVIELCQAAQNAGTLVAANFNSPGQVVVSGAPGALEEAARLADASRGRSIRLRVSGAFHSPLMDDAARVFADLVADAPIKSPAVPVVANATAEPVTEEGAAREAMIRQMTNPVLWSASVRRMMSAGIDLFVEVGPGRVLTNLTPRISADARALPVGAPSQLDKLAEEVNA